MLPPGFNGLSGDARCGCRLRRSNPAFSVTYAHGYFLAARRKPEVSEAQAISVVSGLGERLAQAHPEYGGNAWSAAATSLQSSRVEGDLRLAAMMLLGAVAAVLLIACVNLTNLLIARALGRRREVAVRLAIGASRAQVARQFLAESLGPDGVRNGCGAARCVDPARAGASLLPAADAFFRVIAPAGGATVAGRKGSPLSARA